MPGPEAYLRRASWWARAGVGAALLLRLGGLRAGLPSAGLLFLMLMGLHAIALIRESSPTGSGPDRWREWAGWLEAHWFAVSLVAVIGAGIAVRLPWAAFGLGHYPIDIDERRLAQSVLAFFRTGALPHETPEHHPGILYWLLVGSFLLTYVACLVGGLGRGLDQIPVEAFVFAGRLTNVLIAAGTIVIVALIAKRLSGSRVAILAAGLFAIAPLSVQTSTELRNDVAETLFVAASVYVALEVLSCDRRILPALAGGLAGLATGVKYTAVFVLLPVVGAALLAARRTKRVEPVASALAAFAIVLAATNHFLWSDFPNFVSQLSNEVAHAGEGHWAARGNPGGVYRHMLSERGVGLPLACLAVGFGAFGLASRRSQFWLFLAFPLAYIGFMTQQPAQFPRWVHPVLPFVAVAGCAALGALVAAVDAAPRGRRLGLPARFVNVALILVAVGPTLLAGTTELSHACARPTHALAEASIQRRAAPADRVLLEDGWLDLRGSGLPATRVRNLGAILNGNPYELQTYDWVVVPETRFKSAGLERLSLVEEFVARREFGGSPGFDLRIYKPPSLDVAPTSADIRLASPDAAAFLGAEWQGDDSGRPGLALPADGGRLFLPMAGNDVRCELELADAGRPGDPVPVSVSADGGDLGLGDVPSATQGVRILAGRIVMRPTSAAKVIALDIQGRRGGGTVRVVRVRLQPSSSGSR